MTEFDTLSRLHLPVTEEIDDASLVVLGEIPPELHGAYLRNGPNPRSGESAHPFFGDGMLHGVWFEDGRALRYANRWVRTPAFTGQRGSGLSNSRANTSVIEHAGRILALEETSLPYEMRGDLSTVGAYDFGGRLTTPMTAHPKICSTTGEMLFFGAEWNPSKPALTYHRAGVDGTLLETRTIDVPGHTMMHDFAITENHVIFLDLPVVFDLERAKAGTMPFRWSDDYGARLGVMNRSGGGVRWFEIEPCYIFHVFNAYDDGSRIVLDAVRHPELWRNEAESFGNATLHRWTIDLMANAVHECALDDAAIEFPTIDNLRVGKRHRFGYATRFGGANVGFVKYDFETGRSVSCDFGADRTPGEPLFVPSRLAKGEDDGWLITYVYDATTDKSDCVIRAASDLSHRATIQLSQRVPAGFHGAFIHE